MTAIAIAAARATGLGIAAPQKLVMDIAEVFSMPIFWVRLSVRLALNYILNVLNAQPCSLQDLRAMPKTFVPKEDK